MIAGDTQAISPNSCEFNCYNGMGNRTALIIVRSCFAQRNVKEENPEIGSSSIIIVCYNLSKAFSNAAAITLSSFYMFKNRANIYYISV
jgi:hypothetical protein